MIYVSLDIETTGLDPKRGQVLELAMVIEDTCVVKDLRPAVEALPHYHTLVPVGPRVYGDVFALEMNADLIAEVLRWQRVRSTEVSRETKTAFDEALRWLNKELDPGLKRFERLTLAGKNAAGFDLPWLRHHAPDLARRFRHRVLDPGSVFADFIKDVDALPSLADLVPSATRHRALDDARAVVTALRRAY